MSCKNTYTRNLSDLNAYRTASNRIVEEYFNITDINEVSLRYFKYLSEIDNRIDIFDTDNPIIKPPKLRKVNYMDLMNQTIKDEFKEPYFIFADVSDFSNYNIDVPDRGFRLYTGNEAADNDKNVIQTRISYDELENQIIHTPFSGGTFYYDPLLTGRGTITIDMEQENAGKIYYKVRISTLPHFIKWAYFVVQYIARGNYNINVEV